MEKTDVVRAEKETGRVEAFSDGVFGIAMTLLILDIKVPKVDNLAGDASLASALIVQWPTYLAFVTSFLTVLVMWVNHHRLFEHIHRQDHTLLILNGLLLMGICIVPFPTSLVADFIVHKAHRDANVAAEAYSGVFIVIAILYNVLWGYATHGNRLLRKDHNPYAIKAITAQYRFGPLLYGIAFILAFVDVAASVGLCLLMAIYFALPEKKT